MFFIGEKGGGGDVRGEFALLHVYGKCVTKLSCSICLLSLHIDIEDDIFTAILGC